MFRVTWCIDVEADAPEGAARRALEIQRNGESTATVFAVRDYVGNETMVDLLECFD